MGRGLPRLANPRPQRMSLLGTYQGHVLSTQDPSHACVLSTQNPAWPNGPTDSAPRGYWGICRGQGTSPYIYFVKNNNNNNKFV